MKYFVLDRNYYKKHQFCTDFKDDYRHFKGRFPLADDQREVPRRQVRVVSRFRQYKKIWELSLDHGRIEGEEYEIDERLFEI